MSTQSLEETRDALPPEAGPRISFAGNIYFQAPGEQPYSVAIKFSRLLGAFEQPYLRKIEIGPEWKALDRGWVEKAGYLVLVNDGGHGLRRGAKDKGVVEVGLAVGHNIDLEETVHPFARVPIGEALPFYPGCDLGFFRVRCASVRVKASLHLLPGT